jgi:hypothetical protein
MLQNISVYFQWLPLTVGGSTRHNRNMDQQTKAQIPQAAAGQKSRKKASPLDALYARMRAVLDTLPVGRDIGERLLGLDHVWQKLLRIDITPEAIARLPDDRRLKHWGFPEERISSSEQACLALFTDTVVEFALNRLTPTGHDVRPAGTSRDTEKFAAPYFAAARVCKGLMHQPPLPSPEQKATLEAAANYVESWTRWQLEHQEKAYLVGERTNQNRGFDNKVRARVRALAATVETIFGKPLHRTVAMIANAALVPLKTNDGREGKLTDREVINWRSEI